MKTSRFKMAGLLHTETYNNFAQIFKSLFGS